MDDKKKPFMFTIWDDLADNEGAELVCQLHEHPVILAKRVVVTKYRSVRRLAIRYNSTISINPTYSQATALMDWPQDNEQMLRTYTLRSSSASSSVLNLTPVEDAIVSISAIPTMTSTRKINRLNCAVQNMLVPRRYFEVDIIDSSDTLRTVVGDVLAENMLSMTTEQVYNTVAIKPEAPSVGQFNRNFGHKLFKIQLHKPPFRIPYQKTSTFTISSFSETEPMFLGRLPASTLPGDGSKKPKRDIPPIKK